MKLLAVGVFAALVLSACASDSPDPRPTESTPAPVQSADVPEALMPGTEWILVGPNTAEVRLAGRGVTVTFAQDGTFFGAAPVNTYSGTFTATGDTLEFGPIARTEMAGEPEQMAAEDQYFQALALVDAFDADGEQLWLRTGDTSILRYGLEDSAAAFGATLVGKPAAKARRAAREEGYQWRVVSVDGVGKPVTQDYRGDRLNATVVNARVIEITVG